ncbi:formylglycine-generating enzyme family protein [Sphingobacterium rhinopitheci]|uniref:formylglycine-generating enzyme family protein n=1 Tax=Sphingobacterium rhinopitheci TaxID=2781960 RepID=UPI001F51B216|nr:SUMF1/EgtB/PvdO family nonheme iron enzyme [Sphingobacterium rhinopitheci]MCI0921305.1 SUMF1/EgtB/PvdO family nonheme iron enzyme [Sphingobacterium rhinopitheci]
MKRLIIAIAFLRIGVADAQVKDHKNYVQEIKGTTLSFPMQAIHGGEFLMGSSKSKEIDEKPVHKVKIDPFWMGAYEVTWDLFESFLYKDFEQSKQISGTVPPEVDAITRPTKPYLDMTFGMGKDKKPALAMTQYNAIQFCKWLYTRTGVFYRLPTEAEWEYAARAGSNTEYFFGDDSDKLTDYAWYSANSDGQTQQVGLKKPNAFGIYDIYGNVAEWTYDQYSPDFYKQFEGKVATNPIAEPTDLYANVVRGGGFNSEPNALRSASRDASDPVWKQIDPQMPKSNWWFPEAPFIGFRLVRPLVQPSTEEILAYYDKAPIEDYN